MTIIRGDIQTNWSGSQQQQQLTKLHDNEGYTSKQVCMVDYGFSVHKSPSNGNHMGDETVKYFLVYCEKQINRKRYVENF